MRRQEVNEHVRKSVPLRNPRLAFRVKCRFNDRNILRSFNYCYTPHAVQLTINITRLEFNGNLIFMTRLFLLPGIVCSTVIGLATTTMTAPFAMPPHYAVVNDWECPFYQDANPTPEATAIVPMARTSAAGVPFC